MGCPFWPGTKIPLTGKGETIGGAGKSRLLSCAGAAHLRGLDGAGAPVHGFGCSCQPVRWLYCSLPWCGLVQGNDHQGLSTAILGRGQVRKYARIRQSMKADGEPVPGSNPRGYWWGP
jgi:hypothetical protein